ncbi:Lar family restriction alleviation protein, partial [Ralstonia pseudosolanacearum]
MCEITLSPCPFCGGAPSERLGHNPGGGFGPDPVDVFSVCCNPCGVRFVVSNWPGHVTEDQKAAVRAKWNH